MSGPEFVCDCGTCTSHSVAAYGKRWVLVAVSATVSASTVIFLII